MALLKVLRFPDPRLRTVAKKITDINAIDPDIINNMVETMYHENGIGLAATQVDFHYRLIVVDTSEDRSGLQVLINPEIIHRQGEIESEEGCLSVPGCSAMIQRAEEITVKALDQEGKKIEIKTLGLNAVCIQHELDHLEGKLFVDYLSPLKRDRIARKLEKEAKRLAREKGSE